MFRLEYRIYYACLKFLLMLVECYVLQLELGAGVLWKNHNDSSDPSQYRHKIVVLYQLVLELYTYTCTSYTIAKVADCNRIVLLVKQRELQTSETFMLHNTMLQRNLSIFLFFENVPFCVFRSSVHTKRLQRSTQRNIFETFSKVERRQRLFVFVCNAPMS